MLTTLNEVASQIFLLPGSLLILMIAGCICLASRFRRTGWVLLVLGIGGLGVLSMPFTAHTMIQTLEPRSAIDPHDMEKAKAVVVLGGDTLHQQPEYANDMTNGSTLARLRYAAFLYNQYEVPMLLSGGRPSGGEPEAWVMKRELETLFHVPVRWIEAKSNNTDENARFSWEILHPEGITTIVLLTHAWHMPRAKFAFERAGFTVIAAPTVFHTESLRGIANFLPQASYLELANTALHEWLGMLWYRR
ncbi:YdcF family protein [Alcaligenaceae bacterium]|nr:YdcF family protein [Alcaligenaceae bacterium]